MIKRLGCYLKAIPFWAKMGFRKDYFVPHLYKEITSFRHDIFVKSDGTFRIANSYTHEFDETYIHRAYLTGCECKRCGHKILEWQRVADEELPVWKEK